MFTPLGMLIYAKRLCILLLCLGVLGCAGMPGTPAPQDQPQPVEIRIADVDGERTLRAEAANFSTAATTLTPLLASIDTQTRTLFTPERFAEEIAAMEHVYLRFGEDVSFSGQGIQWTASELVVAAPAGEPMLLARASGVEDWSVYLPAEPAAVDRFITEIRLQVNTP